jgi:hypothetical protein
MRMGICQHARQHHGVCYFQVGAYLTRVSSTLLPALYNSHTLRYTISCWESILRGLTWTRDLQSETYTTTILGPIKKFPNCCERSSR